MSQNLAPQSAAAQLGQNLMPFITADDALNPTWFNQLTHDVSLPPWGIPATGKKPRYPPNIPSNIRELMALTPLQEGPIGRNIRPVIVEALSTFSAGALHDIDAFLAFQHRLVLKDIANLITAVVRYCWARPTASFSLSDFLQWWPQNEADTGSRFNRAVQWMQYQDRRLLQIPWSRPYNNRIFEHIVFEHVLIEGRPSVDVPIRVSITACDHPEFELIAKADILKFVNELPALSLGNLSEVDSCGVCLERYGEGGKPEEPVKVNCGHVIGRACLLRLLTEATLRQCPLCRCKIEVPINVAVTHRELNPFECDFVSLP